MQETKAPQTCNAPDDPTTSAGLTAETHCRELDTSGVGLQMVEMITGNAGSHRDSRIITQELGESFPGH